jgi:hypothetical protein
MRFPFSAPNTKIQRARKHLAELEAEVATFLAGGPAKFKVELATKDGILGFQIQADISGPPESMSAVVGDVIHNLRAALDLTACEMVRAAGQNDKDVYFPFSESADELDNMMFKKHFDRAGAGAVTLLRSLKPYKDGNAALRVIHDLDIQDKHRALIPQVMGTASPIIRLWDDDRSYNPTVVGNPAAASEIKLVFPTDNGLHGRELVPTLHELVTLVEGIIEAFRGLANRDATDS